MFKLGEKVFVNKSVSGNYAGKGTIEAVCSTPEELGRFFQEDHPYFSTYLSWIMKNKKVYVVKIENIGHAGFLSQELSKELV
ncbi:MAG: hypothetical protein LRY73_06600 [Bacillus sp. (in: Bacteria)]|nr:hypothetical protein [Bacillus sp. (in: firmicutes)]